MFVLVAILLVLYGWCAFVAVGNLLLMSRPRPREDGPAIRFLIPARDEAENLRELLPQLLAQGRVTVFDDESSDGTGDVARSLGAEVITPDAPLAVGWTGKNRACHELGHSDFDEPFLCFLDADVRVSARFAARLRAMADSNRVGTAFPTIVHGRFPEPIVLGWVGWSLLAFNPFFLVRIFGFGHNGFTNGQMTLWPKELYRRLRPNERLKGQILEDVLIGRLLAKQRVGVDVADLSRDLSVRMYDTWRQALDGMSKNSFEITGTTGGAFGLAALLFALGWGWLASPAILGGLLLLSSFSATRLVRANPLYALAAPLSLTVGAYTMLRSWRWRRTGRTAWKGRFYPAVPSDRGSSTSGSDRAEPR